MTIVTLHIGGDGNFAVAAGRVSIGRAQDLVKTTGLPEQAVRLFRPSLFVGSHVYFEGRLAPIIGVTNTIHFTAIATVLLAANYRVHLPVLAFERYHRGNFPSRALDRLNLKAELVPHLPRTRYMVFLGAVSAPNDGPSVHLTETAFRCPAMLWYCA